MRIALGFCRGFMTVVAAALGTVLWLATAMLPASAATVKDVTDTYADIALATYEDATTRAKALKGAIEGLIAAPSDSTLGVARSAWKAARVPYMQTEAFRFGNKIVDEWEGQRERLAARRGPDRLCRCRATAPRPTAIRSMPPTSSPTGRSRSAVARSMRAPITKELLRSLQEAERIEANVATGYHAIEFLLWGQDLNGTGPGAGTRPAYRLRSENAAPAATAIGGPRT